MNKIIIIGPIFKNETGYIGEGAKLYYKLKEEGYDVITKSAIKNKALRFLDILWFCVFSLRKTDIVLLQSYGLLAFIMEDAVTRICKWKNIPLILTLHGGAFVEFYKKYPNWVKKVLSRADQITTPSLFLQKNLSELNVSITHLPNFIDLSRFKNSTVLRKKNSILWVRGFHEIYNPELAIEIMKQLALLNCNATLTMIGKDQGLKEKCETLAKANGLENAITFHNYIDNSELPNYYQTNKVFLNTTRYESFGVSLIEAASCGLPSVSTNPGEIPYLWTNGVDMVICERSPKVMAKEIQRLFIDEEYYNAIVNAALIKSKAYSWDKTGPIWNSIIKKHKKTCAE